MSPAAVEGLDVPAMTAWLEALGIGADGPISFERIGLGQSNLTFLATDAGGQRWVLRRPPLGKTLASAHDVAREHRILAALQGTDVPTPAVYGLCEDAAVSDVPVMVVEHVDGIVLDGRADAEALSQQQRHAAGLALVDTLAKIHAVDLERTGLADLASHKPYGARQLRRWKGQWDQSKMRELPEIEDLTDRPSRSSFVTTSESPSRRYPRASVSAGRFARVPDACSTKILSQPAALSLDPPVRFREGR